MTLTLNEWVQIEAEFRDHARKWAELHSQIDRGDEIHDHSRYDRLATASKSAEAFSAEWKYSFSLDDPYVIDDFREVSPRFRKEGRLIRDAMRATKVDLRVGPKFLDKSVAEFEDAVQRAWPNDISLVIDHACYALYVAWRPTTRVIVPDDRPKLLRAMALDESLFRVVSPRQFEELVAYVYECLGCRVELTQESRDFGADVLAWHAGPLNSEVLIAVQVKRYAAHRKVGLKGIFELHGAVTHYQAHTGHIVTSSDYSKPAREFAQKSNYHLVELEGFQSELLRLFGEVETPQGLLLPSVAE